MNEYYISKDDITDIEGITSCVLFLKRFIQSFYSNKDFQIIQRYNINTCSSSIILVSSQKRKDISRELSALSLIYIGFNSGYTEGKKK